uniref:Uncharacterized protein n=1 Tax=Rhizophora mucronata TaxID=61149 RepID=A0A2P2Q9G6_RHIMU
MFRQPILLEASTVPRDETQSVMSTWNSQQRRFSKNCLPTYFHWHAHASSSVKSLSL